MSREPNVPISQSSPSEQFPYKLGLLGLMTYWAFHRQRSLKVQSLFVDLIAWVAVSKNHATFYLMKTVLSPLPFSEVITPLVVNCKACVSLASISGSSE